MAGSAAAAAPHGTWMQHQRVYLREALLCHSRYRLPCSHLQATNTGFHLSGSTGNFTESDVRVLPTAEYLRANDLITHGEGPNDQVPEPYQTFDSARFPADLLDEVRRKEAAAAVVFKPVLHAISSGYSATAEC
jgi:hypothetical protein